jgi:hypothetical protein
MDETITKVVIIVLLALAVGAFREGTAAWFRRDREDASALAQTSPRKLDLPAWLIGAILLYIALSLYKYGIGLNVWSLIDLGLFVGLIAYLLWSARGRRP